MRRHCTIPPAQAGGPFRWWLLAHDLSLELAAPGRVGNSHIIRTETGGREPDLLDRLDTAGAPAERYYETVGRTVDGR